MPNHIHGIIFIVETGLKPVSTTRMHGLSEIVRGFKTFTARKINEYQRISGFFWQSRFYDRIIRDEQELENTKRYIQNNPKNWEKDELYL